MDKVNLTRPEKSLMVSMIKKGFVMQYYDFYIRNAGDNYLSLKFENSYTYGLYHLSVDGLSEIIKDLNKAIDELNDADNN